MKIGNSLTDDAANQLTSIGLKLNVILAVPGTYISDTYIQTYENLYYTIYLKLHLDYENW